MSYNSLKIILLLFPFGLCSQNKNNEIITSKFKQSDSIAISLKYKESDGCLGYFVGRMEIKIKAGKFSFIHFTTSEILKSNHFEGEDESVIDYFIALETQSKKQKKICSSVKGDHCYGIELTINDHKTEFMYVLNKEEQWNGLATLIDKLESLKKTTEKKD